MRQVRRALLQAPMGSDRRWLAFEEPVATLAAESLDAVVPALAEAERAAAAGLWVVGFVAYDAAPAFDAALVARRDAAAPLALFGVFEHPIAIGAGAWSYWSSRAWALGSWSLATSPSAFAASVRRVQEWIAAGEVYQVNVTVRCDAPFSGDSLGLFRSLAARQNASHMAYLELGDAEGAPAAALCSASPELFLARRGERLVSRPMKGTMPRYDDSEHDRRSAAALGASVKERAENTMIVDMVRNDLGRVAHPGSVVVESLHEIESYPTVHQMTSTVSARSGAGLADLLRALFPPASITGAPKVRCSELIAELEPEARGVYTGAVGVLAPGGDCELSVAIRTVWIDLERSRARYGVGCGIVADSDPVREVLEVMTKARVLGAGAPDLRLLETMCWRPGLGVERLDRHLARLTRSAKRFGFPLDPARARGLVARVEAGEELRLRLQLGAGGDLVLEREPLRPLAPTPWRVPIDTVPVVSHDEWLQHKTTAREVYEAARARHPEAPDVVLYNERQEVTETTIGNLVVEIDGRLVTPPVSSGLLPGVQREELLERGEIAERVVSVEELRAAPRCWMINAVRGWTPLTVVPCQELHGSRARRERSVR